MKINRFIASMAAAVVATIPAYAYFYVEPKCDFESDGLYYNICDDGLEVVMSGYYHDGTQDNIGWPYHADYAGDIVVPESVYVPSMEQELPVVSVAKFAFSYCDGLRSVKLPSTLIRLGVETFMYSTALTSVDMSECVNLTELTEEMFAMTPSLQTVVAPPYLQTINKRTFYASGIADYCIPDVVVTVCDGAFDSTRLRHVKMGKSLRVLGTGVFIKLSELDSVEWNDSLEQVGEYAFFRCEALKRIELPETAKEIGHAAFAEIIGLESVVCRVKNPEDIRVDRRAFAIAENKEDWTGGFCGRPLVDMEYAPVPEGCVLYVPAQSVELYRQADVWKEFAEIRAIDDDDETSLEQLTPAAGTDGATYDLMGRRVESPRPGQLVVSGGKLRLIR